MEFICSWSNAGDLLYSGVTRFGASHCHALAITQVCISFDKDLSGFLIQKNKICLELTNTVYFCSYGKYFGTLMNLKKKKKVIVLMSSAS